MFFKMSEDFQSFFTSCNLDDFRQLRKTNQANLIFLISQVSQVSIDFHIQIFVTY